MNKKNFAIKKVCVRIIVSLLKIEYLECGAVDSAEKFESLRIFRGAGEDGNIPADNCKTKNLKI